MPRTRQYNISPFEFRRIVREVLEQINDENPGKWTPVFEVREIVKDRIVAISEQDWSTPRFYTVIRQFDKTMEIEKEEKYERDPTRSFYDQFDIRHMALPKGVRHRYKHL